jgi:excisionase family DNA binding protein
MKLIGTDKAAEILGIKRRQVQNLVKNGKLPAMKVGRDLILDEDEVRRFATVPRKPGRKPKESKEGKDESSPICQS